MEVVLVDMVACAVVRGALCVCEYVSESGCVYVYEWVRVCMNVGVCVCACV